MRRSCGCLRADEVIAVVKIGCVLAAPYLTEPSHTHRLAWYRIRPCSDDASAQCPGILDAGPEPRPDHDVRSVVYRRAHGPAHFHAADLGRRLGSARRSHGRGVARSRRPARGGLAVLHPVWTVRCDRDAARGNFLGFRKKAIDGPRNNVMFQLARAGAPHAKEGGEPLRRRSWPHCAVVDAPSRCPSSSRLITSGHRSVLIDSFAIASPLPAVTN